MKLKILSIFILISFKAWSTEHDYIKDYCVGYFEELYWSLDPIDNQEIRDEIKIFFSDHYKGAEKLDFDLFYNSQTKQFITETENIDVSNHIKVNYPNFEIMILDTYINLFKEGQNYCPAFWDNCKEDSINNFFKAAEDFSNDWRGEDFVISFLENNMQNHKCSKYFRTSINQKSFVNDLNILIKELTR